MAGFTHNEEDKLVKAFDAAGLVRQVGFPFIMPILKQYDEWEQAKQQLDILIGHYVDSKYENITVKTGIAARKHDWKIAILKLIKRDFWKKGTGRELIALESLKTAFPEVLWVRTDDYWDEYHGIDIKGTAPDGKIHGISVKGFGVYYDTDVVNYVMGKMIAKGYNTNKIYFVNEVTREIKILEVE